MRPTDRDLFAEEKTMPSMSFGDHLEELRVRLILALLGLFVGVIVTFIPPLELGRQVLRKMQDPAQEALDKFYDTQAKQRAAEARKTNQETTPFQAEIPASAFAQALRAVDPDWKGPADEALEGKSVTLPMTYQVADWISTVNTSVERKSALISLAPLETFMIYFMVCMVTGLVVASPWVFYQIWAFVAAGLYRHERHYVIKFLPFSLGLFPGTTSNDTP